MRSWGFTGRAKFRIARMFAKCSLAKFRAGRVATTAADDWIVGLERPSHDGRC